MAWKYFSDFLFLFLKVQLFSLRVCIYHWKVFRQAWRDILSHHFLWQNNLSDGWKTYSEWDESCLSWQRKRSCLARFLWRKPLFKYSCDDVCLYCVTQKRLYLQNEMIISVAISCLLYKRSIPGCFVTKCKVTL